MTHFYFVQKDRVGHIRVSAPDMDKALEWINYFYPHWQFAYYRKNDLQGMALVMRDRLIWQSQADIQRLCLSYFNHP